MGTVERSTNMRIYSSHIILGIAILIFINPAPSIAEQNILQKQLSPMATGSSGASDKSLLVVTPEYIIGPEDVLEITVWKNPELSKEVQVRPDGRISLQLLGDLSAVGKTPVQLTDEISAGLKRYMEHPTISMTVKDVQSYQIYVLGEVNRPGKYPLKSKTTLLQGITVAGGFTGVAAKNAIVIFRFTKDGQGQTKLKASYDDIVVRDGSGQNIELMPGDMIVIPSETMIVLPKTR